MQAEKGTEIECVGESGYAPASIALRSSGTCSRL